jgi:flagellar basal body rod protein FlgC
MDATTAIALSGLTAASARLQVSAVNLAEMDDAAFLPASAAARPSPFAPAGAPAAGLGQGGVQAQLAAGGPGADPASELLEQMQALQQYRASAALIAVDDRLRKSTIALIG